jgi:hypothetical protein
MGLGIKSLMNSESGDAYARDMFEKEYGFALPESTRIDNHKYYSMEEILCARITFDKEDLGYLETNFLKYYGDESAKIKSDDRIFDYSDTGSWWDLNPKDAIFAYRAVASGEVVKTRFIYTFIVDNLDGTFSMYVTC